MLSKDLKKLRKQNRLTLVEVSKKTGISIGYLSELENARKVNPHPHVLKKIALVYKVSHIILMRRAGYL